MMKWEKADMGKYIEAKEYIDTVIIPLQPFHLSDEASLEKDTFQREVLSIYANDIEKELSGRVLLTPTYHYFKYTDLDVELQRLNEWIKDIKTLPFKNIFLITFELDWKKQEQNINGHLIWLPGLSTGDIRAKETIKFIQNQVEQVSELIRSYW